MNVSLKCLSFTYTLRDRAIDVLENISIEISSGEFVALVGPSGCGKTTLLRVCAGLLPNGGGQMSGEAKISTISPESARRKGLIGMIFQRPFLLPWRTVISNVRLPIQLKKDLRSSPADPNALIEDVGLKEYCDLIPATLSEGMKQRVSLARAMVTSPKVLLMDEPFSSLDEITRTEISNDFLRIYANHRFTVVLVTHDLSDAALLADRVIVLSGRPARIVGQIDLPFPRPRRRESPNVAAAIEKIRQLWEVAGN